MKQRGMANPDHFKCGTLKTQFTICGVLCIVRTFCIIRMPRLSHDQRNQAIGMLESGATPRQVSLRFGCHRVTINRLRERLEETGSVKDRPRPGAPRKTSRADDREVQLRALRTRSINATKLQHHLRTARHVRVSAQTVRNRLHAHGLWARRPYRGLVLQRQHRRARVAWATRMQRRTLARWAQTLFSDECRVSLDRPDGRDRVWRRRGERMAEACITEHDRFGGGGSVMVWGGITASHRTDLVIIRGNLNAQRYRDEILQQHVRPFMRNHPEVQDLQQDNARPHTARICMQFLQDSNINVIPWPAKSPDLSPIENLWSILKVRVKERENPPTTVPELEAALEEEWRAIPQHTIRNLFNSMRKRCTTCIQAAGGHTGY